MIAHRACIMLLLSMLHNAYHGVSFAFAHKLCAPGVCESKSSLHSSPRRVTALRGLSFSAAVQPPTYTQAAAFVLFARHSRLRLNKMNRTPPLMDCQRRLACGSFGRALRFLSALRLSR